jgi:hypothetical protein
LHRQSKALQRKATEILELDLPWYEKHCLDELVDFAGAWIEDKITSITHKDSGVEAKQRTAWLNRFLGLKSGTSESEATGQFADPAALFAEG